MSIFISFNTIRVIILYFTILIYLFSVHISQRFLIFSIILLNNTGLSIFILLLLLLFIFKFEINQLLLKFLKTSFNILIGSIILNT